MMRRSRRHADARQALSRAAQRSAFDAAVIYGQWGDIAHALDSLETAMRQRDPYLIGVRTWSTLDPLRKEPRFQAIEKALKFP